MKTPRIKNLADLVLEAGRHTQVSGKLCLIEAHAAWLGEPHSDRGVDEICPRIEAYGRALNDWLLGPQFSAMEKTENSRRLIAVTWNLRTGKSRLENTKTADTELDNKRRWLLQEVATSKFAASAFRAAGLNEWAGKLAKAKIKDEKTSVAWAAEAAWAAWAARAARAAWAAEAARAAWAAEAVWAARAAKAVWAARAAGAAEAERAALVDISLDLMDQLVNITERKPA